MASLSALTRFGPNVARTAWLQHHRQMASAATSSDPVQKLFVEKIREFKTSNKGLDQSHEKIMGEEMSRLRRVYQVEDEAKLAQIDHKFAAEVDVSLRDIDEESDLRQKIASGEIRQQMVLQSEQTSAIVASVPDQTPIDLHMPINNKPDARIILENEGVPIPPKVSAVLPDYMAGPDLMTPEKMESELGVTFGKDMPTIHDDKKPERDVVNFPRIANNLDLPPRRLHIVPESWFQFFYPKTGLTGPYALAAGFSTLLLSKEWLPMEHEILTGFTSSVIFGFAIVKFGPKVKQWLNQSTEKRCDGWDHWQKGHIEHLSNLQSHYKSQLDKSELLDQVYAIRKQDLDVQLEKEHRDRIRRVYEDTKRRLNYLVAVADSQRQIAHKNMVNWVVSNAASSFGAKQEAEVLDNCVMSLKQLGAKNANVI